MKKQNGMTIIEVLLSVVIIGIVLLLLFSLLIQVRNEDNENNIQSNFIINQSTYIKEIEEDIINYGVSSVSPCKLGNLNLNNETVQGNESSCIKLTYSADYLDDNIGFLVIYRYYTTYTVQNGKYVGDKSSWMIEYQRGKYKEGSTSTSTWKSTKTIMKEIPDEVDLSYESYIKYTALENDKNAASIVMPIVNADGDHYDINLSFLYDNHNFTCYEGGAKNTGLLKCKCSSSDLLCTPTIKPYIE